MAEQGTPNIDRFIGVVSVLAALLLFALQSNDVEMNWMVSLGLYILVAVGITFSCLRDALPHAKPLARYVVSILLFGLVASIGGFGTVKQYEREHPAYVPPQSNPSYLVQWGKFNEMQLSTTFPPKVIKGDALTSVTVDAHDLYKYRDKYRLVATVMFWGPNIPVLDVQHICKSKPYDIEDGNMVIPIEYNETYLEDLFSGDRLENYTLLAVPIGVSPDQFDSLRQARSLGAINIGKAVRGITFNLLPAEKKQK